MRALRLLPVVVLVLIACLPRIPRQRLSEPTKIAVAWVVDPSYAGAPFTPPDALKVAVTKELADHNLQVVELPLETVSTKRLTDARFEATKWAGVPEGATYFLLVEQRVQFFSQIDGRYRWEVSTAFTASRTEGAVAKDPFEIPVVLMFDHEKEREAIVYAAPDIANRVGVLIDGLLAGAEGSSDAGTK